MYKDKENIIKKKEGKYCIGSLKNFLKNFGKEGT
jgi:hypothetical protein